MTDISSASSEPAVSGLASLADRYGVPAGHFDELRDGGTLRPEWREFAEAADELDAAFLAHAAHRVSHQLHEDGVTYNVYASPPASGGDRPWALDVLPTIVNAAEWRALEEGLVQWGRLLEMVACDLYGERRLLHDGVLPAPLVLDHPGFLRPCHGIAPPGGTFLHVIAFDLARAADGRWRLLGTRTQVPSGLGYALENRAIVSRLFPDALRAMRVRSLAPFADALQERLVGSGDAAPANAVVLMPGPFNETYFEHVYLARQMGLSLVQGGDLTVRHDKVFLKTVSGLREVHTIWRRLDDDFADPLELRADSTLGVPGLLQAWRAGQVTIVNSFGMGVLESAGLLAYAARVAARLTGEVLRLEPVPAWWCGEPEGRERVHAHLRESVIRPTGNADFAPVLGCDLTAEEQRDWIARVDATPDAFVVQALTPLPYAPAWNGSQLEGRAHVLRAFVLADSSGAYRVLPGGLSRIAGADRDRVSRRRGGSSKDAWVLPDGPSDSTAVGEVHVERHHAPSTERTTSSRAAEHLFWLGRYAERSENAARLLRATLHRISGAGGWPARFQRLLVRTCRNHELLRHDDVYEVSGGRAVTASPADTGRYIPDGAIALALMDGVFNRTTRHSLAFDVDQMVRVASSLRERLSSDNWRVLNRLSELLAPRSARMHDLGDTLDVIDDAIVSLVAVGGLEMAHMTRDDGWRFLSLGRHLERLAFLSQTLDDVAAEGGTTEPALLEWLLDLSDSLITYRARHMRRPEWSGVLDLLLFDERNPRALMFQVAKLGQHVRLLPGSGLIGVLPGIDRLHAAGRLGDGTQGELFGDTILLERLPGACTELARTLSDALALRYFSHVYDLPYSTVTP